MAAAKNKKRVEVTDGHDEKNGALVILGGRGSLEADFDSADLSQPAARDNAFCSPLAPIPSARTIEGDGGEGPGGVERAESGLQVITNAG